MHWSDFFMGFSIGGLAVMFISQILLTESRALIEEQKLIMTKQHEAIIKLLRVRKKNEEGFTQFVLGDIWNNDNSGRPE